MKLFPTQDARRAALRRIHISSSATRTITEYVVVILIIVASFMLAPLVRNYLGFAGFPGRPFLIAILFIALVSPFYYRSRVRRALRAELVQIGVPICVNCAYHLAGLAQSISKCPECGDPIDPSLLVSAGR